MVTPTHPAPRQSREGSPPLQKIQVPKRGPRAAQRARAQVPPGVPGSPGGPGARAAGVSTNASARMWPFSDTQVRLPPESIPQLAVGVTSQPVAGLDVSLNASEAGSRDVKEVPGNQRCAHRIILSNVRESSSPRTLVRGRPGGGRRLRAAWAS